MDGMDGCLNEWMDGWMEWMNGMCEWMDGLNGWMAGRIVGEIMEW